MFQGGFKEVSRRFQWCLEEVSRAFQRSYMNVRKLHSRLKGILRDFKGVSRKFQGCFMKVSWKSNFNGCFKGVS